MMPMKPKICTPIQHPGSPSPTSNCNFGFTSWEEAVRQPTSKSFDHSLSCYITNVSSESPKKLLKWTPLKRCDCLTRKVVAKIEEIVYIWKFEDSSISTHLKLEKPAPAKIALRQNALLKSQQIQGFFRLKDLSIKSREWNVLHFEPRSISQRI